MRMESRMSRSNSWLLMALVLTAGLLPHVAWAQAPEKPAPETKPAARPEPAKTTVAPATKAAEAPPAPSAAAQPGSSRITAPGGMGSFLDRQRVTEILKVENPLIWPMILCSVVAFGYFLDRWFSLRRSRIVPREFVNRFLDRLGSGKLDRERAFDLCKANDTPASRVFAQILMMWGEPAGQIRAAISQAVGMEYMQLRKNIRVLNATATLAPLIGLLGTVVGIIESFNALGAKNVPSKSAALAEGIGLALVMTALGLVVAIGSVTAYYYLLGKLDSMMVTLEQESLRVMELIAGSVNRPGGERRAGHLEMSRGIDSRIA